MHGWNLPRPTGQVLLSQRPMGGATAGPTNLPQPLQIPGCALWLDSSQNPLPEGTPVPVAPDRSGQGRHCVADQGQSIPVYNTAAFGGLGALLCSGLSEYSLGGPLLQLIGPCAVIAVVQRSEGGSFFGVNPADQASTTGDTGLAIVGGVVYIGGDGGGYSTSAPLSANPTGPCLLRWYRDGSGWDFRMSGCDVVRLEGQLGTFTVRSLIHRHTVYDSPSNDLVAEVLIYAEGLMTVQRDAIEGYLCSKWGILR